MTNLRRIVTTGLAAAAMFGMAAVAASGAAAAEHAAPLDLGTTKALDTVSVDKLPLVGFVPTGAVPADATELLPTDLTGLTSGGVAKIVEQGVKGLLPGAGITK